MRQDRFWLSGVTAGTIAGFVLLAASVGALAWAALDPQTGGGFARAVTAVALLLLCGVGAGSLLWVVLPLRRLADNMRRLAEGDGSVDIPVVRRRDELGDIARSMVAVRETVATAFRLGRIVDDMPQAIMLVDPGTGLIT